jgi:hypothetical protein
MSGTFYRRVEILNRDRHAGLRLHLAADIRYAAELRDCPIVTDEFREAAKTYPIVFARDQDSQLMALVVMGFPGTGNLWIDENGLWRPANHIPAYVRRYPFAAVESGAEFFLGLDMDFEGVGAPDGEPLFDSEGQPTPTMNQAAAFIDVFLKAHQRTQAFLAELERLGLLRRFEAEAWTGEGEMPAALLNLLYIDKQRMHGLPDRELVEFVRNGYYALAVAHLASLTNFGTMTAMMAERKASQAC